MILTNLSNKFGMGIFIFFFSFFFYLIVVGFFLLFIICQGRFDNKSSNFGFNCSLAFFFSFLMMIYLFWWNRQLIY